MTQPSYFPDIYSPDKFHYIGECYANWLKSEGAVVVPIIITKTDKDIIQLLDKINGVVIPGGDLNLFNKTASDGLDRFTQVTKLIINYSINLWFESQQIFPVWGTCQGFQSILIAASQSKEYNEILEEFFNFNNSENLKINRKIKPIIFNEMTQEEFEYSQKGFPFFFWHQYGISPKKFSSLKKLQELFDIASISVTENGTQFVSIFEGKNGIPIYASQFHPERVFVWLPDRNINHSPMSFQTNQYFAKFIIDEAKKNFHSFENLDELYQNIIEVNHYSLEKVNKAFMLCYFFNVD